MNFRIRIATAGDVPAMHRVRTSVRENRLSDPQQVTEASYLPYIRAGTVWLAEGDIGILGFAAIDTPAMSVWALFIHPDAEGGGVGRALHLHMLASAQERGLTRLSLCTQEGTRAECFYKRAGWTEAGKTDDGELLFEKRLLS